MLVQPTISHFVKNLSKSQPLLNPKQEASDEINLQEEDDAAVTYDPPCDKNQNCCENKLVGRSNNPFAIKNLIERQSPANDATANEEGLPLNQVKQERGGHKSLSLKDRKRRHRTLSISPQSAGNCSKKVCSGIIKNENVHPNSAACRIPNGGILKHSEKVEDCEKIKISGVRKLSCEFTMEEEALMSGYALESEQLSTKKLSLADLDVSAKLPSSVNTPIQSQTPSKGHILSKMNKSSLSSIPCSPSFSPRNPTPKAFSPFFERTTSTSSGGKEAHLVTDHVQASGSVEDLESSAVLFSTPAAEDSQGPISSHSTSKSMPRRTLKFDEPGKQAPVHPASPVYQVNETILPSTTSTALSPAKAPAQSTASTDEFSFISDISLSEFADVSCIEVEASLKTSKKFALNRHLVLEVTNQESSSDDALLCTGRYADV